MVIPKGVVEIQYNSFRDCAGLREVVFEAGSVLKKIGDWAFYGCMSLRNIQLPDGLETIGIRCFKHSGLEEAILPKSVKSIEPDAF